MSMIAVSHIALNQFMQSLFEDKLALQKEALLQGKRDFTLDGLVTAAYDSYLPWFIKPLPALIQAWDQLPAESETKAALAGQIAVLRQWDLRWSVDSVATSLAIFWGREVAKAGQPTAHEKQFSAPGVPAGRMKLRSFGNASLYRSQACSKRSTSASAMRSGWYCGFSTIGLHRSAPTSNRSF